VKRFFSRQFLNLRQSAGLLGVGIGPTQGRYIHRTTQTRNKLRQTLVPVVGFEPTIPVFERAKTFQALDRAATVIGECYSGYTFWRCVCCSPLEVQPSSCGARLCYVSRSTMNGSFPLIQVHQ
jgi:hypothetical protein